MPTIATSRPQLLDRRLIVLSLPLLLLLAAAIVTNVGGGIASEARAANTITVTSTLGTDIHITSTCGAAGTDGTIAFGAVNAATAYDNNAAPCTVVFGSANSATNLRVNSGSASLGWTGFAAKAAACGAPAAGQIGIRADSSGTATETAPYNCADGSVYSIPIAAATFCTAVSGPDVGCDLVVGFNTGSVAPGAMSGTLTTSLT